MPRSQLAREELFQDSRTRSSQDTITDDLASVLNLGRSWLPALLPDNINNPGQRHILGCYADAP